MPTKDRTAGCARLQDFEIAIPRNEFLCLLGPSGCGKSSFLRIVTGLMKPIEGEVQLNGKRIEEPGLDRGIVFQEPALFPWLTALRNVAFGLEMSGMDKHAVNERAAQVLAHRRPRTRDAPLSLSALGRHEAPRRGRARLGAARTPPCC